jgi:hypothetical protein
VGIGCAVAVWFYELNEGIETSKAAFILFIGKIKNELNQYRKCFLFNSIGFWFFGFSCSCYIT